MLVGCSFAGLELLYRYVRIRRRLAPGEVTVIEPHARHGYVPLSHEAASGASTPDSLCFDVARFCRSVGVDFVESVATRIDLDARVVHVEGAEAVPYDRLVIAVGSEPAVPAALAGDSIVPAKRPADATALGDRIRRIHTATRAPARLTIIGAGITGVEWAAELAATAVGGIRPTVTLVGMETRVLATFAPGVARHAARVLDRLGVRCVLGRVVRDISGNVALLDDGQTIDTDVAVWAGGVRPNQNVARLGLSTMSTGHIAVTPRLAIETLEGVYAVGDVARVVENGSVWPTMERAIEAIWQGSLLARRLAGQWSDDDGPTHRLRRDFFYGLSLGPRHSVVVYGHAWVDSPLFVWFRRWLERAYYARFALVARWLGRAQRTVDRATSER